MIAVDTDILVYAHRRDAPYNEPAFRCVRALAEARATWAIPWPCVHEFLSVVTNPKIFRAPTPPEVAVEQVGAWLASPSLVLLTEASGHWDALAASILTAGIRGPQVHDARIAVLCLGHGVRELWTADRDFARWPELATFNPLLADAVHESLPGYGATHRARAKGLRRAATERRGT